MRRHRHVPRALALIAFLALAHEAVAQEQIHRGVPASPLVSLRIFVPSGSVRVAVWSRDSVDVRGSVGATASVFGGGNRDYVKFGVEPVRTGDARMAAADWVVTVPRRAHVWVKMTAGAIEADGTEGEVELYAVGGSIQVRRASGTTSVESIDASVVISSCSGDIRVRGGKAELTLRDVLGTASITSVSGRVEVRGASAPESRIETIGGDILIDVVRLRGAALDLQTHSGNVTAIVDAAAPPKLDLASRTGAVVNPARGGTVTQGTITVRSFRGGITVRLRQP